MKTIGIKLADGSFYPILEDNTPCEKELELTTAHNNQTKVMVDLYRSASCSMEDAEYVDSLQIENLVAHPNGEPNIKFLISIDENNQLSAKLIDSETGIESGTSITLVSRTLEERLVTDEYDINDTQETDTLDATAAVAGVAGAAVAGGLLASAANFSDETTESNETTESTDSQETFFDDVDTIKEQTPVDEETFVDADTSDINFDSFEDSTQTQEETQEFAPQTEQSEEMSFEDSDSQASNEEFSIEDSPLSDMDFDIPESEPTVEDSTQTQQAEIADDFFTNDEKIKEPTFDSASPVAGGLNFDGLYDEETKRGSSSTTENNEDDVKKKTKVPVIICIVCAIICIIATLLVLITKHNLKKKNPAKTETAIEQPAQKSDDSSKKSKSSKTAKTEPAVPEAKEDEVIIIEKAEKVVPTQPKPSAEKSKNITYRIKWGDTLWDIADSYYKNPWRYKYIARYNGIRNPDFIISGTVITIPAE